MGHFQSPRWLVCGLVLIATCGTHASQASAAQAPPEEDDPTHVKSENAKSENAKAQGDTAANKPQVVVQGKRWLFNRKTRYAHSLPEVDGATITVTKKTTVVKLDDQPPIIDNNQRELFDRLPGMVLAEQQNPTQLNVSYRGLGNPQESEYVLLMQDGIPLELDWIGYPTTYYLPVPQTLSSVQMIRAGSGLLYGPEPQPVINFVSRAPAAGTPFAGTTEQVGGNDGLFSSFNSVSGTSGNWNYLANYSYRYSSGERENGDYTLNAGDLHTTYRLDARQSLSFDLHLYSLNSGLAGLMSYAQFQANPNQTTTPDDRLWTTRDTGVLTYDLSITDRDLFVQKLWTGYTDLITRTDQYSPEGSATASQLSSQRFHYTGLDGRWLHRWGQGNALTVGYTAYGSSSPYNVFVSDNPYIGPENAGTLIYNNERKSRYAALFAESLWRFERFHLVASARFDHQELVAQETVAPHPNLVDQTYTKNIPLFGVGIGNDFGRGNETYLNVSQGFRPLRYLDIASPFTNYSPGNNPDPTQYLTYEAGVHGWPELGLYYDVSLFQVNARNRIESQRITQTETIDVNTGNTRSRGVEAEASYDLLRLSAHNPANQHLTVFANASLLDATFTASAIPGQVGKTPAYAPDYVLKGGVTLARDGRYKASLVVESVGSQYFQDNNQPVAGTPARIPAYTVADLSAEYVVVGRLRVLAGISNLGNRHYYSRVFLFGGMLEPARERAAYAGLAYDF